METSVNVLFIKDIKTEIEQSEYRVDIKATLNAELQFHCPITGNKFADVTLEAYGVGNSKAQALRMAIQNFINGDSRTERNYHDVKMRCIADHQTVHSIQYDHIEEPYKSLFAQLFDESKWDCVKLLKAI